MINLLIDHASKIGFLTHDDIEQEMGDNYFACEDCSLRWIEELKIHILDNHSMFIQVECYNLTEWGFKVMSVNSGTEGAPIIHETEEPEFTSYSDALFNGVLYCLGKIVNNGR